MVIDGNKIRKLREKAGMTQSELGDVAGVSYNMINFLENEKKTTNVEILARIAQHFNVAVDDLLKKQGA